MQKRSWKSQLRYVHEEKGESVHQRLFVEDKHQETNVRMLFIWYRIEESYQMGFVFSAVSQQPFRALAVVAVTVARTKRSGRDQLTNAEGDACATSLDDHIKTVEPTASRGTSEYKQGDD
ncbi:hypothetical protein T265_04670 [Opisthorchis viverrini]|uniref:Uncharacterized protein n=1 Tax=Opisthorchis viverrini TaxID=6198 RepID=A0A074ZMB9_OPIVI|nr:hypothetical protein T265_04670 [Opisthorchis viverrini]KER28538.1 hypothetical protein T265_04670 [Opisthorchis viverrini]